MLHFDSCLRHLRGEPGGVDLCKAVFRTDLGVALEDAGAVLVDVPAYIDSEHLAVKGVHECQDSFVTFSFVAVEVELGGKEFFLLVCSNGFLDHFKLGDVFAHFQHYIVKAVATITEPGNTVDMIQWTAYGEAADSGDKAISKMQTNAFKNIIANNLLVAELSVEGEDLVESVQSAKDEGKSVYNVKKEVAKETVLKTHAAEPVKTNSGNGPTTVQQTIIEKIMNKAKTVDEISLAPFGTIDEIEQRYRSIKTVDDASAFIADLKGVVSLQ